MTLVFPVKRCPGNYFLEWSYCCLQLKLASDIVLLFYVTKHILYYILFHKTTEGQQYILILLNSCYTTFKSYLLYKEGISPSIVQRAAENTQRAKIKKT